MLWWHHNERETNCEWGAFWILAVLEENAEKDLPNEFWTFQKITKIHKIKKYCHNYMIQYIVHILFCLIYNSLDHHYQPLKK